MKPEDMRVWRKGLRNAAKGIPTGRRTPYQARTEPACLTRPEAPFERDS